MFTKKKAGELAESSIGIIDKAVVDKDKKADIAHDVVINELNSGSDFVRNARPMIVYVGLFVIISEVFGLRMLILSMYNVNENIIKQSTSLLEYFLFVWGGIVAVYSGGRDHVRSRFKMFKKK
jgi:ABC-type bacteriocin/lantibiotic exporter with double-glycine peptidase domain